MAVGQQKLPHFTLKLRAWPCLSFNPLSANFTKWSNTPKQFVAKFPTNCLSVFDLFVGLTLTGLRYSTLHDFIKLKILLGVVACTCTHPATMEVKFPDKAIIKIKVSRSFVNQNVIRDEYQSK